MKNTLNRIAITFLAAASIFVLASCADTNGNGGTSTSTAPSILTVGKGAAAGEVKVTWSNPVSGFDNITSYTVYYAAAAGVTKETTTKHATANADATQATFVIASFAEATEYFFAVTATNADGESDISEEKSGYPYQTDAVPSALAAAPTVAAGTAPTTDVSVTFTHLTAGFGADGGDMLDAAGITTYKVIVVTSTSVTTAPADTAAALALTGAVIEDVAAAADPATETTVNITGLTTGTAYKVYVIAVNAVGNGALSQISAEITPA